MKKTICAILLVLAGFGCSKKSGTTATTTTTGTQFGYVNGACYDYSRSVYVANTNCSASATSQYTYANGVCVQTSTGQQVDPSLCNNNTSNTGYVYNNGYCYSTTTGQYVDNSLCAGAGNGMGNGAGTGNGNGYGGYQQCYGTYIYMQYGQQQYVTCNGSNCRGYMLYQPSTGQPVYCQ